MKKRSLLFITAIVVVILVSFIFSACNNNQTDNYFGHADFIQIERNADIATYQMGLCESVNKRYIRVPLVLEAIDQGFDVEKWKVKSFTGENVSNINLILEFMTHSGIYYDNDPIDFTKMFDYAVFTFHIEVQLNDFEQFVDKKIETITFAYEDEEFTVNVDITIYDATQNGTYRNLELIGTVIEDNIRGGIVSSFTPVPEAPYFQYLTTLNEDVTINKIVMRNRDDLNDVSISLEKYSFGKDLTFDSITNNLSLDIDINKASNFSFLVKDIKHYETQIFGHEVIVHYTLKSDGREYFTSYVTLFDNNNSLMAWVNN